jgi:hypothetical protein
MDKDAKLLQEAYEETYRENDISGSKTIHIGGSDPNDIIIGPDIINQILEFTGGRPVIIRKATQEDVNLYLDQQAKYYHVDEDDSRDPEQYITITLI